MLPYIPSNCFQDQVARMDSLKDDKTSVSALHSGDGTSGQASMTIPAVDLNENKTGWYSLITINTICIACNKSITSEISQ